jgi:cold shock CspA family protein
MLYFAAIPYAYDIAIAVIGDSDFIPVLQNVRRLGKRVAIASIRESCSKKYSDPKDAYRVKDFDIIWLGDYLDLLELKIERRRIECQSPFHEGERFVYTTDFIRKGKKFFCESCKVKFRKEKEERSSINNSIIVDESETNAECEIEFQTKCEGIIKSLKDEGYGFITGEKGDYFFHHSELINDTDFNQLNVGDTVIFEPENEPNKSNREQPNGKAINVEMNTD